MKPFNQGETMLYQTDIYTSPIDISNIMSDISVKIHGAAMNAIPKNYAAKMHEKGYHPFSVFTVKTANGLIIRVSALCDEASIIPETLCKLKNIKVFGASELINIINFESAAPINADDAEKYINERSCILEFVTPAMVKTKGKPSANPDICGYFRSVINKYNTFEHDMISFDEFQEAFSNADIGSYYLESTKYNVSGVIFPGMIGSFKISFPLDKLQNTILRRIIAYATYSGLGGKTSQGMGGLVVR